MPEQLKVVPESIVTKVVRRDRPSRIGLPMRCMVLLGHADDLAIELTLLGSREQITHFVSVEYDYLDLDLGGLRREITDRPHKASVDTLWRNQDVYQGAEGLLNPDQWLNLVHTRMAFQDQAVFAEGPHALTSRPGHSGIIRRDIPAIWVPTDVFSRNGWAIEENPRLEDINLSGELGLGDVFEELVKGFSGQIEAIREQENA